MHRCTADTTMKIHEYQAKAILAKYGVAVPRGEMVTTAKKPSTARQEPARRRRAGGGGEGADPCRRPRQGRRREDRQVGGRSRRDRRQMLGMKLVTHQTGPEGQGSAPPAGRGNAAHRARALPGHRDRPHGSASRVHGLAGGGMEIEQVAAENPSHPEGIHRARLRPGPSRRASWRSDWLTGKLINPAVHS